MTDEFWKRKSLREMSRDEWESLCDGCALCCLHKLENEETGEIFFTDVACKLLDTTSCRCTDYSARAKRVADCLVLSLDDAQTFEWLPGTCAYRRLANGQELPEWHPLITGDADSVHAAGISVQGRVRSERDTDEIRTLWKLD